MAQIYALKLGGSIVSPSQELLFDFNYLKDLKTILLPFINAGDKFFITLGGGYLMRMYRDLAEAAGISDDLQLHLIGTTVNVLHGELVRAYFADLADDGVYKYEDYYSPEPLSITKAIKVGGGGKPGHSGDVDATLAAGKLSCKTVISLKNIDHVYSADPKKDPTATRINQINWQGYLDLIGNPVEHEPGANYPIDPIAAKMAKEQGMKFVIIDGRDFSNLSKVLAGEPFNGTTVQD